MQRSPSPDLDQRERALLGLLRRLADLGYQFTTPSPASHRRILLRGGGREAEGLADVFGWSRPFRPGAVPADLLAQMREAGVLRQSGGRLRSTLRVASAGPLLFLHSAFPARGRDAVFFGPDSYRFIAFIRAQLPELAPGGRIIDMGAGSGVGGVFAHSLRPQAELTLTDVNDAALSLARVNAAFAGARPAVIHGEGLPAEAGDAEVILANPPYIGGDTGQTYSDGGGGLGADLSIAWARQAVGRLRPGGRFLLYSGAAIVRGHDGMRAALAGVAAEAGCGFAYEELDADVFPETLMHRTYWGTERIAAVGAVMTRPS